MRVSILVLLSMLFAGSGCTCQIGEGNRLDSAASADGTSISVASESSPPQTVVGPTSMPVASDEILVLTADWQTHEQQFDRRIDQLETQFQQRDSSFQELLEWRDRQRHGRSLLWLVLLLQLIELGVFLHRNQL